MTPKEKAVDNYIREKHNQDECVGFIDGYTQCQEELGQKVGHNVQAERMYTEDEIYRAIDFGRCHTSMTDKQFINSLNKQDK
jgi:hypothetical protein